MSFTGIELEPGFTELTDGHHGLSRGVPKARELLEAHRGEAVGIIGASVEVGRIPEEGPVLAIVQHEEKGITRVVVPVDEGASYRYDRGIDGNLSMEGDVREISRIAGLLTDRHTDLAVRFDGVFGPKDVNDMSKLSLWDRLIVGNEAIRGVAVHDAFQVEKMKAERVGVSRGLLLGAHAVADLGAFLPIDVPAVIDIFYENALRPVALSELGLGSSSVRPQNIANRAPAFKLSHEAAKGWTLNTIMRSLDGEAILDKRDSWFLARMYEVKKTMFSHRADYDAYLDAALDNIVRNQFGISE